jgi:HK97 family phage major capsid protein
MQSTGAIPLDDFIASRLEVAFASRLDQAALYGRGRAQNEPTGVVTATGSVTTGNPPTWADVAEMRYVSTNYDANRDSFGWIINPKGRKYFESIPGLLVSGTLSSAKRKSVCRIMTTTYSPAFGTTW